MKLEWDLIREILEYVEENGDGVEPNTTRLKESDFIEKNEKYQKHLRLWYHYKILFDTDLVYGEVTEMVRYHGTAPVSFSYTGLTFEGHQTLEAMRNDTVWNTIKGNVKKAGITGLKQIPALALAAFMAV